MGSQSKVVFGNPMTAYSTAYSIPNDSSISARIAHFSNFQTYWTAYSTAYSRVDFLAYEALQTHARPQRKACLVFRSLVRLLSTPHTGEFENARNYTHALMARTCNRSV